MLVICLKQISHFESFKKTVFLIILISCLSRLFKYDPLLNSVTIAASNLAFPNGVLLSQFQDYLLVAETTRARISK